MTYLIRTSMIERPRSARGEGHRPTSQYAKMAAAVGFNPRYRSENILLVELDLPTRTTRDYIGPSVAPKVGNPILMLTWDGSTLFD